MELIKSACLRLWVAACAQAPWLVAAYYRNVYAPSGKRLSGRVFAYSNKFPNGLYFIQIGANDGIRNDPIFKAMMAFGWHGLRLEPQPYVFRQLAWLHKRTPAIQAVQAALGPRSGTVSMYGLAFSNARWAHGLCTLDRKLLMQGIRDGSIAKVAQRHGVSIPPNPNDWVKEMVVTQLDVGALVQRANRQTIDLLVIDAEGYDLEIIHLFAQATLWPGAILYEHVNLSRTQLSACNELLTSMGYRMQVYGANTFAERVG